MGILSKTAKGQLTNNELERISIALERAARADSEAAFDGDPVAAAREADARRLSNKVHTLMMTRLFSEAAEMDKAWATDW